jgi:hypothetical protein
LSQVANEVKHAHPAFNQQVSSESWAEYHGMSQP